MRGFGIFEKRRDMIREGTRISDDPYPLIFFLCTTQFIKDIFVIIIT